MIFIIIIYFTINSLLLALFLADSLTDPGETFRAWLLLMLFAIPITIFNSLPKWHFFYNTVIFWHTLYCTDKWADLHPNTIKTLREWYGDKRQFKAMCKKYGY